MSSSEAEESAPIALTILTSKGDHLSLAHHLIKNVTPMPMAQAVMVAVDSQPKTFNQMPIVCSPITRSFAAMIIMTTMIGTATTPLMTALQKARQSD